MERNSQNTLILLFISYSTLAKTSFPARIYDAVHVEHSTMDTHGKIEQDYYQALAYAEHILAHTDLTQYDTHQLIALVKRINSLVYPKGQGMFRTRELFVRNLIYNEGNPQAAIHYLRKNGTDKDVDAYHSFMAKKGDKLTKEIVHLLDDNERNMLKKIALQPPPAHIVPQLLSLMMQRVHNLLQHKADPFLIAAYALITLLYIHPFDDGNGRSSRIFMNCILTHCNQKPITFENMIEHIKIMRTNKVSVCRRYLKVLSTRQP